MLILAVVLAVVAAGATALVVADRDDEMAVSSVSDRVASRATDAGADPRPGVVTATPRRTSDPSPRLPEGRRERTPGEPSGSATSDSSDLRELAQEVREGLRRRGAVERRLPKERREQLLVTPAPSATPATATFRVGTFNVLGASHTAVGGNKPGYAPASVRMPWFLTLVGRSGLDVVGLQEFQASQYAAFRRATAGAWSVFPGTSRGRKLVQNSIAFRTDVWDLKQGSLVDIPYFHGRPFPMPFVLLRHRASGHDLWFVNVHNPASTRGDASRHRARGIAIEAALVNRLHADGTPVVLTGDFNDRAKAFCSLVGRTELEAANGGSVSGRCRPPADPGIDWVFATSDLEVIDYVRDRSALVRRTTDHPFVHAGITLTGVPAERSSLRSGTNTP